MKLFIVVVATIGLLTPSNAEDSLSNMIKEQCEFEVYGRGDDYPFARGYLLGRVNGATEIMANLLKNKVVEKVLSKQHAMVSLACKEALADNSENSFDHKYGFGIIKTIHKDYAKYSQLK